MPRLRVARAGPHAVRGSSEFPSVTPPVSPLVSKSAAIPPFALNATSTVSGVPPINSYAQPSTTPSFTRTLGRSGSRAPFGRSLPSMLTTNLPHSASQTPLANLFYATGTENISDNISPLSSPGERICNSPCPPRSLTQSLEAWESHRLEGHNATLHHNIKQNLIEAHSEPLFSVGPIETHEPPPISPKPLKLKQAIINRNRMSLCGSGQSLRVPPPPPTRRSSFLGSAERCNTHSDHSNTLPRPSLPGVSNGLSNRKSSTSIL